MKKTLLFVFGLSISSVAHSTKLCFKTDKREIKRQKRNALWDKCALIERLNLPPVTPYSGHKESAQLSRSVEDFSANVLN